MTPSLGLNEANGANGAGLGRGAHIWGQGRAATAIRGILAGRDVGFACG
jgi:hypothetical protein